MDLGYLNTWLISRKMLPLEIRHIPEYGVISLVDIFPIGAMFLRKVEGGFGILDGLILAKEYPRARKDEIIDGMVENLIDYARRHYIKGLTCTTSIKSVCDRATKHGFIYQELQVFALDLQGDR